MTKTELIQTLKDTYHRDLRKQVVKTLLAEDKKTDTVSYKRMNQIFSYVLSELGWDMSKNTNTWDSLPLDIMVESFPKLNKTSWYKAQILTTKKSIDIERRDL